VTPCFARLFGDAHRGCQCIAVKTSPYLEVLGLAVQVCRRSPCSTQPINPATAKTITARLILVLVLCFISLTPLKMFN
ncbi:MAG: hypothetical protein ACI9FJ_003077, partial [Alteromonadaceae bacterium]